MLDSLTVQQSLAQKYGGTMGQDRGGRKLLVLPATGGDLQIWRDWIDQFDVLVVWAEDPLRFTGWVPTGACSEGPMCWIETRRGRKIDGYHTINQGFLFGMPETFDFVEPCEHDAAFWKDEQAAWECLICSVCFHDERERERDVSGF